MGKKEKFQKMWGAHAMGVFWGSLIAHNFSKDNIYKEVAGISENNVVFYYHKNIGTEFYNSVLEMEASGMIGKNRFSDPKYFENYVSNSKKALKKSDAIYFGILDSDFSQRSKKEISESLEIQMESFNEIYSYYHACQPQYFSEIEKDIKAYLEEKRLSQNASHCIGLLTSQKEFDVIATEEMEWLAIAKLMRAKKLDRTMLLKDREIMDKLRKHVNKYMSLGSGEGGQPWDQDYYLDNFEKIDYDIDKKNEDINEKKRGLILKKEQFIKENKISDEIVDLANAVGKIGMLRLETRLSWMRLSHTITATLLALGKKLVIDDILEMKLTEIREAEKKNSFIVAKDEIEKRKEVFLFFVEDGENKVFAGNEAIVLKEKLVPSDVSEVSEIKGSVACKGKVQGKVFVIDWNDKNLSDRMASMKEGSILVAGQTRPQLMPVIKKSAAIITDEGGIMCHAAIVSRELGIPCIIGTKIATQVLKDGDLVEVDADNGVVRILEKIKTNE